MIARLFGHYISRGKTNFRSKLLKKREPILTKNLKDLLSQIISLSGLNKSKRVSFMFERDFARSPVLDSRIKTQHITQMKR